ncbi:MAG: hypothetical protein HRU03_06750 [Nanoarchaeales archaeon]|nr:hypothetical protein [Nanoarchaeales archaeon]
MYIKKLLLLFLFFITFFEIGFSALMVCGSSYNTCAPGTPANGDGTTWDCLGSTSFEHAYSCTASTPNVDCRGDWNKNYGSCSVSACGSTGNYDKKWVTTQFPSGSGSLCPSPYFINNGGNSCSTAPCANDGICAISENGQNLYTAPTSFCDSLGGNSALTFLGNTWSWTCFSGTIGDDISCSANKKIDGACNTVTVDQCVEGNFGSLVGNSTHFKWMCDGINTGSTDLCSLPKDVSVLDSLQVEPNSVWYNSSLVKYGTCKYDSSIGKLKIAYKTKRNLLGYNNFNLYIDGIFVATKSNTGKDFYGFRNSITSSSHIEVKYKSLTATLPDLTILECDVEKIWEFNNDLDLFETNISGVEFYSIDKVNVQNFFEIDKDTNLFFRQTFNSNVAALGVDSNLIDTALNLHNIYNFNSATEGLVLLDGIKTLNTKHNLNVISSSIIESNCYEGIYARYNYSSDSAFKKSNNRHANRNYGNVLSGGDLSHCDNTADEMLRTRIEINLDDITSNLTIYQILPKYLVDDIEAIKFVNDGGAQRFIKDKDPIIGWYFNDTMASGTIVLELPGNLSGGTFILAEEPILYNDGEIIVNYRVMGCNPREINLFDLLSLDGSKIYAPGTSFYKVCVTHLSEELTLGTGINYIHAGNYIASGNYSLDSSLIGTAVDINVNKTNLFWSLIISDSNPSGSFSCLGSVQNSSSSLFGDCLFNETNRIWLHLGEDLLAPVTTLTTLYLSHTVPVVLNSVDNLHGSGVDKIYYCVDEDGTCNPLLGTVVASDSVHFQVSCSTAVGCIKFVNYLAVDNAGNYETMVSSSIKMIDAGSSCQADCTVKPSPGRYLAECNGLNSCSFYKYDLMGLFDGGNYVANQCDLYKAGSYVKYNSSHEIKCPAGPFRETRFVDELLDLTQTVCNNLFFKEYPAIIEGQSVLMKVYSCLD